MNTYSKIINETGIIGHASNTIKAQNPYTIFARLGSIRSFIFA